MRPPEVARALADVFIASGDWSKNGLVSAGAELLGARRRWLGPLVRVVLASYHRPPTGAPRELARLIEQAEPFTRAFTDAIVSGRPIRLARHPLDSRRSGPTPTAVPRIDDLAALARLLHLSDGELDWFADTRHLNRRAPPGRLQHYRYEWHSRPGRVPRLLEVPGDRLKAVQRSVLDDILTFVPLHDAAHGFVPGRSAISGASRHTGTAVVIALDLTSFFASVTAGRVYGALRQVGLPESVAHSLTGICTHSVPPWAIARMPAGGSIDERFALRNALAAPHLPQGAPSSPALANIAVRRLDSRLGGWADAAGATYTRYADDLVFSGDDALARRPDPFVRGAVRIIEDQGYAVNRHKTRVRGASVRQQVTGIVVNDRLNLDRREYDRLKAILHNCAERGPAGQNRDEHADLRAHLLGRITWAAALNPDRGTRLMAEFARIRW